MEVNGGAMQWGIRSDRRAFPYAGGMGEVARPERKRDEKAPDR